MENLLKIENVLLYSLVLILCFLPKITKKETKNNKHKEEDEYDGLSNYLTIIVGATLGFITNKLVNQPELIPQMVFSEWLKLIAVILGVAAVSIVGGIMIIFAVLLIVNSLTTKIGIISIIGGWFLFPTLEYTDFRFILIFFITLTIGLASGWATKKYLRKKLSPA